MQGTSAVGKTQGGSAASAVGQAQGSSCFLASYFEMRSFLAQDKTRGMDKLSKILAGETGKFRKTLASSSKNGALSGQITALKDIEKAASAMKTRSLESARESFKGLSRSVLAYVKSYGCSAPVYSFYCDMAKESWLQDTDKIGNPYYGSKMLKCGVMIGHTENGKYVAGKHE
jgi:Cu(I)/Ag(I) efflux system membrane fusion protein